MVDQRLERVTTIGTSRLVLYRLEDCFRVVADMLQHGCDGLAPCRECEIRPRRGPATCPSDWDDASTSLLPWSAAWSY